MVRHLSIVRHDTPPFCILRTKSLTVAGMISIIGSYLNSDRTCLLIT